jgi:hypothetical protein
LYATDHAHEAAAASDCASDCACGMTGAAARGRLAAIAQPIG